jgi:1,2-diacylglycerol 3-alpha-glucosyltransferase
MLAGHHVTVVTLDFGVPIASEPSYVKRICCPITFTLYQNYMAIPFCATRSLGTIIDEYAPNVIHAHHPFLLGNAAVHCARKRGIPIVFTYHTWYEAYAHYVPFPTFFVQWCTKLLVKRYCSRVDGIIAPSSTIKQHITAKNIKVPVYVLPSPIASRFCPATGHISRTASSVIKLLVVSRFVPEKNLFALFDMLAMLPAHYHLTLVGFGYLHAALQERARPYVHRISFVLQPTQEALVDLYQTSHLFVFPSQTDTQGLVLAEAMACGLPVIALDGPGQRDIVHQGVNGFIAFSVEEMAHMIVRVMEHDNLHSILVQGAIQTATKYRPPMYAEALVQIYRETMR